MPSPGERENPSLRRQHTYKLPITVKHVWHHMQRCKMHTYIIGNRCEQWETGGSGAMPCNSHRPYFHPPLNPMGTFHLDWPNFVHTWSPHMLSSFPGRFSMWLHGTSDGMQYRQVHASWEPVGCRRQAVGNPSLCRWHTHSGVQ